MAETKNRAARNRTVTVSDSEIPVLEQQIRGVETIRAGFHDDMIVNADLFDCLDFIPDGYFDLIIIDPPYNLDKDFHGRKFAVMKTDAYEEFLRSWFYRVCDKLKPDGSLYMCGDWKCTSSMQRVIEERLTVVNRISWQREKGRGAKANWKNSMEDIWFAVKNPRDYYFDVDSVKMKRKVIAPYREDGRPKDWEETENGNFRITCPSNFWDDISVRSGQCLKTLIILHKSLKSCMPNWCLPHHVPATEYLTLFWAAAHRPSSHENLAEDFLEWK